MKTVAWYKVESISTADQLAELMRSQELSRDSTQGYIVNSASQEEISAVYVSRRRNSRSFNDIFGNEITNESIEYVEVDFLINFKYSYIEVVSGKTGIRSLLANLSSIANFRIGFSNIAVDVLRWSEIFIAKTDSELVVDKVLIDGLHYPRAQGRLEITCDWNISDVGKNVSSLSESSLHIERLRLRSLRQHQGLRSILFDRTGFCRINAAPEVMLASISSSRQALLGART